jgi:hypothetical protein
VAGVLVLAVHSAETASESFDLFANHYLYAVAFLTAAAPNVAAPAAVYSSDLMTNQGLRYFDCIVPPEAVADALFCVLPQHPAAEVADDEASHQSRFVAAASAGIAVSLRLVVRCHYCSWISTP